MSIKNISAQEFEELLSRNKLTAADAYAVYVAYVASPASANYAIYVDLPNRRRSNKYSRKNISRMR